MIVLPWPYLPKDRHEKFIELLDAFGLFGRVVVLPVLSGPLLWLFRQNLYQMEIYKWLPVL